MLKHVHVLLCTLLVSLSIHAQSDQLLSLPEQDSISFTDIVTIIESQSNYTLSYNIETIEQSKRISLDDSETTLIRLLSILSDAFQQDYIFQNEKIILIPFDNIIIKGIVIDSLSGESMPGIIIHDGQNIITTSNSDGFFSLNIEKTTSFLYFNALGYEREKIDISTVDSKTVIIQMNSKTILSKIIITDSEKEFNGVLPDRKINKEKVALSNGISGSDDLFAYLKMLPGTSVGSEGQNGLNVRGGGPEQNLILMDGLPIYEASHLGGLSSIFITDAIKNVDFYKSGFPARFGGKLSSVVDVRLKDGNRTEFKRNFGIGIEGVDGHIEGPLSKKTSINLNGKFSWFSLISAPLLEQNLDFNNSSLNYSDGYAKVSHWFSPSNRLSLTFYKGSDLIRLTRNQIENENSYSFSDVNRIEWGNTILNLSWNKAISDKVFINNSIGLSGFNYNSRGSFEINYMAGDTTTRNSFDILSDSDLQDIIINSSVDYHSSKLGKFKFGLTLTSHSNSPSIIESEIYLDPDSPVEVTQDSTYQSYELALYGENELFLKGGWRIHSGLRLNHFGGLGRSYFYVQPRLDLSYQSKYTKFGISYSNQSQFIHLLVNPSPGLPSDLWVPSTKNVEPELSHVLDVSVNRRMGNFLFGTSLYYNRYQNVIEYSNVADIIYSLIIDDQLFNIAVDNQNWEDRISTGSGTSYGIEFLTAYESEKLLWTASYTLGKAEREFRDLNNGNPFPYKFDRRHNIASQLVYQIGSDKSIQLNFAYGTGNSFTSATEVIKRVDCTLSLVPISRNNVRVPAFHHLDVLYTATKKLKNNAKLQYSLGVYNIYNRLNPFYVYLFQDPVTLEFDNFRKISIYPIIPKVYLKYSW